MANAAPMSTPRTRPRGRSSRPPETVSRAVEDKQEAVREAGRWYGTMAADLSLIHINAAAIEEPIQEHISDLARNIPEQAVQRAREGLG